jgi:hypothetical protein
VTNIVSPLGRYGKCYRLNDKLYFLYKTYSFGCCAGIVVFGMLQFLVPNDHLGRLIWPHNLPFAIAIAFCALGLSGQMTIASRGQPADEWEREARLATRDRTISRRSYRVLVIIAGVVLVLMLAAAVTFQVTKGI